MSDLDFDFYEIEQRHCDACLEDLYAGFWNGQKLDDLSFSHLQNILGMMWRDGWPVEAIEIIKAEINDRISSGDAAREIFGSVQG